MVEDYRILRNIGERKKLDISMRQCVFIIGLLVNGEIMKVVLVFTCITRFSFIGLITVNCRVSDNYDDRT